MNLSFKKLFLFTFFYLTISSVVQSQLVQVNGISVNLNGEIPVTIQGDAVNTGAVSNSGILEIKGNWMNAGTYNALSGTLIFSGQNQIINHGAQVFALKFNGGGLKRLAGNITVNQSVNFENGIVRPDDGVILLVEQNALVEGGSENAYVDGPLHVRGVGEKDLPIGAGDNFLPIYFVNIEGINPYLIVRAIEPNPSPEPGSEMNRVSETRYWQVQLQQGVFNGSQIVLPVIGDEEFRDEIGVVISEAEAIGGPFNSLGQSSFDGSVLGGFVASATPFTKSILALGITSKFSLTNEFLIPSAFSPNSNREIDRTFKLFSNNVQESGFHFEIYNRWGVKVYETSSWEDANVRGWNGVNKFTGKEEAFGVYTYFLRARFDNDRTVERTGSITLFR